MLRYNIAVTLSGSKPSAMQQIVTDSVLSSSCSHHVFGDRPDVLLLLFEPGVNLCVWRRPTQTASSQELSNLRACVTTLETFDGDVSALQQQQELDPKVLPNWRSDIRQLAELYFRVTEGHPVTLGLLTTEQAHYGKATTPSAQMNRHGGAT